MSILISLENVCLAYGLEALLNNVKLQISQGERVCLIGRNGAGKSSLLRIIDGTIQPDSGTVWYKPALRFSRLTQELPQDTSLTVYEFVAQPLAEVGKLLAAYHDLTGKMAEHCDDELLNQLEKLQHQIDAVSGWTFEKNIENILTRLSLNPDTPLSALSGGWQRRAALARALVIEPELLLLDEPTNHLDISAIQWLEDYLASSNVGLIFITHDRSLLKRLATRIIELDRGNLMSWPGDYEKYLLHKDELLQAEDKNNADFDKKLAQEERWIRQGIKARRTRNEGRVRALEAMRVVRSKRRLQQGKVKLEVSRADVSGQLVAEAENISYAYDNKPIIKDFSVRIMRGDKIGLIGPNGVGKSTLINILLGNLTPQSGTMTQGTKWQVAYFDQLRMALDLEKTVIDNVAEGVEFVEMNGQRKHIISYLADFLFSPARAMTKVKALSGGECNRLLLARLFRQPANILVLDEPTNDLDIETLEILEDILVNYQGTVLLVSHDRTFLDNVVTSTLVFNGQGKIEEFIGGYQDWINQTKTIAANAPTVSKAPMKAAAPQVETTKPKKLSYREQQELEQLPKEIERLETQLKSLQSTVSDPAFYKKSPEEVSTQMKSLNELEQLISKSYARWESLEEIKNSTK